MVLNVNAVEETRIGDDVIRPIERYMLAQEHVH